MDRRDKKHIKGRKERKEEMDKKEGKNVERGGNKLASTKEQRE